MGFLAFFFAFPVLQGDCPLSSEVRAHISLLFSRTSASRDFLAGAGPLAFPLLHQHPMPPINPFSDFIFRSSSSCVGVS